MPNADIFDKSVSFVSKYQLGLVGVGVGAAGLAVGGAHTWKSAKDEELGDRIPHTVMSAAGVGIVAGGLGAAAFANRGLFKRGAEHVIGGNNAFTKSWGNAFKEEKLGLSVFNHPAVSGTAGAVVGGLIGANVSDDPVTGAAIGAVAGAGLATVGQSVARKASADWKALGTPFNKLTKEGTRFGGLKKAGLIGGLAVTAGLLSRAYMHDPEVESESVAERDGMGGAQEHGTRERMSAMQATGDVVLGLHNKRHG